MTDAETLKKAEALGLSEAELGLLCRVTKMSAEEALERTSVLKIPDRATEVIISEIERLPLGTPEGDAREHALLDLMLYASSNGIRSYRDFPATEEGCGKLLLAKRVGMFGDVPPETKTQKVKGAWLKTRMKAKSARQRVRDCRRAAKRAVDDFFDTPVGKVVGWIIRLALFALFAIACIAGILFLGAIALVGGAIFLVGCALEILTASPEEYELMRINRKLDRILKSK